MLIKGVQLAWLTGIHNGTNREKNQTKSDFLTQPWDVSFPFAYEEVENLLGANEYIYILHTQDTLNLNLHSGENQIDLGPTV